MSEEIRPPEVKIHRQIFSKPKIWPINLLFVQDGQKDRISTQKVKRLIFAAFIGINILGFLIGAPKSANTRRDPMKFELLGTSYQAFDIPPGISDPDKPLPRGLTKSIRKVPVYLGGVVLERPRLSALPPGLMAKAKVISGNGAGPVKAQLTESLNNNGESLLESGSVLWGMGACAEDRVQIQFTKVILPNGKTESIKAIALDGEDQSLGIRGDPIKKYAGLFGGSAATSFVGGLADGLQETETKNGISTKKADIKNAVLSGVAKTAMEQSRDSAGKWQNQKIQVSIRPGAEFIIMFGGE